MIGLEGKRILVWGAARSGLAAVALLQPLAASVALVDDAPLDRVRPAASSAERERAGALPEGVEIAAEGRLPHPLSHWDCLVVSPGVPASHPRLREAAALGLPVLSELEVGARFIRGRLVAITGTNGKTTTATLAAHLLGGEEHGAFLAGNVGQALCGVVRRPEACVPSATLVVEVSSFQCEHLDRFHPKIAAVLNVRPDHLDRHGDMAGYIHAKAQMGRNLMETDTVIVNADDPQALEVVESWRGERLEFSLEGNPEVSVRIEGDTIILEEQGGVETLLRTSDVRMPGRHSLANAMVAAAIARRCAVECVSISERCQSFEGVPHRIEWVANERGVDYYNDSKATNIDSLRTALESFDRPVILIAGGLPKGEDFGTITDLVASRVRTLILIGQAAEAMERAWSASVPSHRAQSFGEAVERAREVARGGDVVLLSPGCASFDMFRDFEDRGDRFREAVRETLERGTAQA
ncbi:UDP-N-acetylmuramoyl-L-alanine--D-glutamate ligase [Candidatus Sumerlaeota bacterium]|nr:UDP-N-acetylmuramoyl-L-alanine--D-glutamate ligase [Candidatus Sumerlaeota bacterium]